MIAAARVALAKGDARGALESLLRAWRELPARELAEAIEVVGMFAARGMHPPVGTTELDRNAMWEAEAARHDPVMLQRLLETVTDVVGNAARVARLKLLAAGGADPRVAMTAVALVTGPRMPYIKAFSSVWNPLFDMLTSSGDPRVRDAIATAPWTTLLRRLTELQRAAFRVRLAKLETQLAVAFPSEPPLSADDAQLLREIVTLAKPPSETVARDRDVEAGLLAAVYAAPGETGPREIYADWLQERGDPRGELIALQLAHPEREPSEIYQRLRLLREQHRLTWLGELAPYIDYEQFAGGFLVEATLRRQAGVYVDAPPHPAWSTLHKMTGGVPASDAHPMPVLKVARGLDALDLRTLAALAKPPPLVTLEWRSKHHPDEAVADFATIARRTPTLQRFEVCDRGSEALAWAWQGTTIRELAVEAPSERLAYWFGVGVEHRLATITVWHDGWSTTLASGKLLAKQGYSGNFERVLPLLEAALEQPHVARSVTDLEITVFAKHEWKAQERQRMAALLACHPAWAPSAKLYGYIPPA